jgi:hypothetical protein
MHVCLLCDIIIPTIKSNEECVEEGEVFEYQEEEDQGLANQGKPSIRISESYSLNLHVS